MSAIRSLCEAVSRFSVFIGQACSSFYLACIVLSVVEVTMRYAFDAPTDWSFETVMTLCASAWLLSSGHVTQRDGHIAVSTLIAFLPARPKRWLKVFHYSVGALALGVLAYAAWHPAALAVLSVERTDSAFNPAAPAYLKALLVFASGLGCVQMLINLFLLLAPSER